MVLKLQQRLRYGHPLSFLNILMLYGRMSSFTLFLYKRECDPQKRELVYVLLLQLTNRVCMLAMEGGYGLYF